MNLDKLLAGEAIELSRVEDPLPEEERERRFYVVRARLEGDPKAVSVEIYTEIESIDNPDEGEKYDHQEVYRLPFTKDKYLLERILKLANDQGTRR